MGSLTLGKNQLYETSIDIIGAAGFGKEFRTIQNKDNTYKDIIEEIFKNTIITTIVPRYFLSLPIPKFTKIRKTLEKWKKYLVDLVEEKQNNQNLIKNNDVLSKMMNEHNKEDGSFSKMEIVTHAGLFIAAGHETVFIF
jgi:cytochrome P450